MRKCCVWQYVYAPHIRTLHTHSHTWCREEINNNNTKYLLAINIRLIAGAYITRRDRAIFPVDGIGVNATANNRHVCMWDNAYATSYNKPSHGKCFVAIIIIFVVCAANRVSHSNETQKAKSKRFSVFRCFPVRFRLCVAGFLPVAKAVNSVWIAVSAQMSDEHRLVACDALFPASHSAIY